MGVRLILKLLLSWLFHMATSRRKNPYQPDEAISNESTNGHHKLKDRGEEALIAVLERLKRTINGVEEAVGVTKNGMATGPIQTAAEVNALRAEVAELRADVRTLKRLLAHSLEVHARDDG